MFEANENRQEQRNRQAIGNCVEMLMKSQDGRMFLRHLLDMTGVFRAYYGGGDNVLMFEGRRSVGTEILALVQNQDKNNLAKLFGEE